MMNEETTSQIFVEIGDGWKYFDPCEHDEGIMVGTISLSPAHSGALVYNTYLHVWAVMRGENAEILPDNIVKNAITEAANRQGVPNPYLEMKTKYAARMRQKKRKKLLGIF